MRLSVSERIPSYLSILISYDASRTMAFEEFTACHAPRISVIGGVGILPKQFA